MIKASKVSVIIPTCNRPGFLNDLLLKLNHQTFRDFEVIVVNDGDSEITSESLNVDKFEFQVDITQTGGFKGVSFARNSGAEISNGSLLAFLDDDDWWDSSFLSTMHNTLIQKKCDVVMAGFLNVEDSEISEGKQPPQNISYSDFYLKNPGLTGSNFMIKKSEFLAVGFDPDLPTSNDMDFGIRLFKRKPKYHVLQKRLVYKNEHAGDRLTHFSRRKIMGSLRFYNKYKDEMPLDIKRQKKALVLSVLWMYFKSKGIYKHRFFIKSVCLYPQVISNYAANLKAGK